MHFSIFLSISVCQFCIVSNLSYMSCTSASIFPTASTMAFCSANCSVNFNNMEFTVEAVSCFTLASYSFTVSKTVLNACCDSNPEFSTFACSAENSLYRTVPSRTSPDCCQDCISFFNNANSSFCFGNKEIYDSSTFALTCLVNSFASTFNRWFVKVSVATAQSCIATCIVVCKCSISFFLLTIYWNGARAADCSIFLATAACAKLACIWDVAASKSCFSFSVTLQYVPQALFDAVLGFTHDKTLYLVTLLALLALVNNSHCVPLTTYLLDLHVIDFAQQHYPAHVLHLITHPSSQMPHCQPAYLHSTPLMRYPFTPCSLFS